MMQVNIYIKNIFNCLDNVFASEEIGPGPSNPALLKAVDNKSVSEEENDRKIIDLNIENNDESEQDQEEYLEVLDNREFNNSEEEDEILINPPTNSEKS